MRNLDYCSLSYSFDVSLYLFFFFFLMIRRPPRSTLFPTRRSSDLDVIPWGLVQGPLADLIGLNVVGMRRRGFTKADIHRIRQTYQAMFFGAGTFRERLDQVAQSCGDDPHVGRLITFIRSGTRPLTM